jgi:PIN domain nuclease of toxin-antitoxin system
MTIKMSLGKLELSGNIDSMIDKLYSNGFEILPIVPNHLISLSTLDFHHKDPFDRIIISQGISEEIQIISSDSIFNKYDVGLIWK